MRDGGVVTSLVALCCLLSDLELRNTVEHALLKQTQAVAVLKSRQVAVATGAGLHLLGPEGNVQVATATSSLIT